MLLLYCTLWLSNFHHQPFSLCSSHSEYAHTSSFMPTVWLTFIWFSGGTWCSSAGQIVSYASGPLHMSNYIAHLTWCVSMLCHGFNGCHQHRQRRPMSGCLWQWQYGKKYFRRIYRSVHRVHCRRQARPTQLMRFTP